jgi:hypothetical protein
MQRILMWKDFILKKLNDLDVRKEYQIKIPNRFAALGNLSDSGDINSAWEHIENNIKTSFKNGVYRYESKQHKPWFDEEYS